MYVFIFHFCRIGPPYIRMGDKECQMSGYCRYAVYSKCDAGGLCFSIQMKHVLKQERILSGSQAHELYCCVIFF